MFYGTITNYKKPLYSICYIYAFMIVNLLNSYNFFLKINPKCVQNTKCIKILKSDFKSLE